MSRGVSLQVPDPDVSQLQFHWRPAMHLKAEQSAHRAVRCVLIHRLSHQRSIENVRENVAAGDDVNLIPFVHLDETFELIRAAKIGNDPLLPRLQARSPDRASQESHGHVLRRAVPVYWFWKSMSA